MGPTASGKTSLAVELVKQYPFEIISVDSAQIYRGMDIGTGKPSKATLKVAPHRLLDIKDPIEAYSAADFRRAATREISSIIDSGKVPLLVGGTMLYFRILRDGMADLPKANNLVRKDIEVIAKNHGWDEVHHHLARVDLEVFLVSGRRVTDFYSEEAENHPGNRNNQSFNLHFFGILPVDRVVLHKVIADRFDKMLREGLIAEVELLYQRGDLTDKMPAIKSVGYRQVWQYLSGQSDYSVMIEKSVIATRQLAKRQSTWMKSWDRLNTLTDCGGKARDHVLNYVEVASMLQNLDTPN